MKKFVSVLVLFIFVCVWTIIPVGASYYGSSVYNNNVSIVNGVTGYYDGSCVSYSASGSCGAAPSSQQHLDPPNYDCAVTITPMDENGGVITQLYSGIGNGNAYVSGGFSTYSVGGYFSFYICGRYV